MYFENSNQELRRNKVAKRCSIVKTGVLALRGEHPEHSVANRIAQGRVSKDQFSSITTLRPFLIVSSSAAKRPEKTFVVARFTLLVAGLELEKVKAHPWSNDEIMLKAEMDMRELGLHSNDKLGPWQVQIGLSTIKGKDLGKVAAVRKRAFLLSYPSKEVQDIVWEVVEHVEALTSSGELRQPRDNHAAIRGDLSPDF